MRCLRDIVLLSFSLILLAAGAAAEPYVWRNARIGGGGYMPNIVFSKAEKGLAYLRSDMGGAYRWDHKAQSWIALQDGDPDWNARGIESIAPDPKNPDIVYLAAGVSRNRPAYIMISHDRGTRWTRVQVPFRMGGNDLGRDIGERLAVDPNNGKILYFASRYDGLQRSLDGGLTWSKVDSFPYPGRGLPPGNSEPLAGLGFVIFDPKSAKDGKSQTVFVANSDDSAPFETLPRLYRSDDGGASWQAVAGTPNLRPIQGGLAADGMLYITFADGMGPYMVSKGAVMKLDIKTGAWTDISPDPDRPAFAGLSLDAQNPGTLIVAPLYRKGGDTIWRTTDGGATWTSLKEISKRDVSQTPFLLWGRDQAEFGWWMTGLAIDPFDSSHIAYTTGATVYASFDIGKDSMLWKPWTEGVEQTAVIDLISPPEGPPLIGAIGDIGTYTYQDLDVSPPIQDNPIFTNGNLVDYAGRKPNVMVRMGTHYAHPHEGMRTASLAWSEDFGKSWQPLFAPPPPGYSLPRPMGYNHSDAYVDSPIAVAADGVSFIVSTPDAPSITRSRGRNWAKVKGLPKGATIIADRSDGTVFFAIDYAKAEIYLSIDSGFRFRKIKSTGLPADISDDAPAKRRDIQSPVREIAVPFLSTPTVRGDLWFVSKGRLFHSRDNAKHFVEVKNDLKVAQLAFGKAPKGSRYPALFAIADKGDLRAIWRSDDVGKSWIRINDDDHEYFRAFRCIAGDPRVFGRVYVGTDGRGIVYGEPKQ